MHRRLKESHHLSSSVLLVAPFPVAHVRLKPTQRARLETTMLRAIRAVFFLDFVIRDGRHDSPPWRGRHSDILCRYNVVRHTSKVPLPAFATLLFCKTDNTDRLSQCLARQNENYHATSVLL